MITLKQHVLSNPNATLSGVTTHSITGSKMISPDMMVAFLAIFGIGRAVEAEDSEAAFALRRALQFGSEFNLIQGHPASVESLLSQISVATDDFKAHVLAYANPETFPFKEVTQAELDAAKRLMGTTIKTINKLSGNPVFTLNESLESTVSVTFWGKSLGFMTENLGRAIHVKDAQKYKIDLSGKNDFDELEIRVACSDVDFTVSY